MSYKLLMNMLYRILPPRASPPASPSILHNLQKYTFYDI